MTSFGIMALLNKMYEVKKLTTNKFIVLSGVLFVTSVVGVQILIYLGYKYPYFIGSSLLYSDF